MRLILVLCLCLAGLSAADLTYAHVRDGAEELTGWWDSGSHVMYLDKGGYRWVKEPASVAPAAAPAGRVAPTKRGFQRLPDLPYGRVELPDGRVYVGWFHEPMGQIYQFIQPDSASGIWVGPKGGAKLIDETKSPISPMPKPARDYLDAWAIEHADEITPRK